MAAFFVFEKKKRKWKG